MDRDKVTCGPLYRKARNLFTENDSVCNRAFAQGFMVGQAEKVYTGACLAAMFRPSSSVGVELVREWGKQIAGVYGLFHGDLVYYDPEHQDEVTEIWLCDCVDTTDRVRALCFYEVNSPGWHTKRASLTGVKDVDIHFHKRQSRGDIDGNLEDA